MNPLELPFDQYQRYKMVQEIIDSIRHKDHLSILDVGASAGTLAKFLDRDTVISSGLKDQPALQAYCSGLALPFCDGAFDVVTSVDSLEHIASADRISFLKELSRVSSDLIVVAAPFQTDGVLEAEQFLDELIRSKYGEPYHFLDEHKTHGLPKLDQTIEFFKDSGYQVVALPNGYLHHWLVALSVFFLLQWRFHNPDLSARFSSYYNTHFYPFDNREPSYRKVLACSRNKNLQGLDRLQNLTADRTSDQSQHLVTLTALARVISEKWSERAIQADAEVEKLTRKLQEQSDNLNVELERPTQKLLDEIVNANQKIETLSDSMREKETRIEGLNQELNEVQGDLKSKQEAVLQRDNEIQKLHRSTQENSEEIQMLHRTIREGERFVEHFQARSAQAEQELIERIRAKEELETKLKDIKSSLAWKIVQRTYGAFLAIAPYQSRRWKFVMRMLGRKIPRVSNTQLPRVSIIIPVFNNCDLTRQCVQALRQNTNYPDLELIVIDDGSTDDTAEFLATQKNLMVLKNESNQGFVLSCNRAASVATGKYIVLLNNDTLPRAGWLHALVSMAENDATIGACGAKLVYPDGRLQEAGGIIFRDGTAANFGNGDDPNKEEYNYPRDTSYCSGACLLVRRDLWIQLGGFDEQFSPAYFEDVDLCFAIRNLGYRVLYQPKSEVTHIEGGTAGTDVQKGAKRFQIINYEKFVEKWKAALQQHPQ